MEDKKPDWSISDLYSKAFNIVKKNKVLWIFGLAVAGGSSVSYNQSRSSQELPKLFQNNPPAQTFSDFSQVLGTQNFTPFNEAVLRIFQNIPIQLYILLAVCLVLSIIIFSAINVIYQAWSQASLIQSSELAIHNHKVSIQESSLKALPRIKTVIWLNLVPSLIFVLIILSTIALLTIGLIMADTNLKIIFGILVFATILLIIYTSIMLTTSLIWAIREAVIYGKPGLESLKTGYKIARKKFWATVLLGLVNNIATGIIIAIPLAIIIGLFFSGFISLEKNQQLASPLLFLGGTLLVIFMIAASVIIGMINAFKAVVWNLAYKQIKGKYE